MSAVTRRGPVATVGQVQVFAPSGTRPYHRLRWTDVDGRVRDTTAGRSLAAAMSKAATLDIRLARAAGPAAMTPLADVVAAYLAAGRSPYTDQPWQRATRAQIEDNLRRALRGHEHRLAVDVDRALLDRMRAQAGTPNMVRINTTALRALLLWGFRATPPYFTAAQVEHLSPGVVMPLPALVGTPAPPRRRRTRRVGESSLYVAEEDAPSAGQVVALSRALGDRAADWGGLAPELAANCGPRWGEQFQLTADDVHPDGCTEQGAPHVHLDWQIDPGGRAGDPSGRRARPKGHKTRLAPLPATSFTGYPLRALLLARSRAAKLEQAAGTNPQGLLFPSPHGKLWWHSGFAADVFLPAARAAGWPMREWVEVREVWDPDSHRYTTRRRPRMLTVLTWHSLRHRFARVAIDVYRADPGVLMALGGWENEATVQNRYYRTGAEHTRRGLDLFGASPPTSGRT